MAYIDYGAIVMKNGNQINNSLFMDMKDFVGWEDNPEIIDYRTKEPLNLKGSYFAYIGDAEITLCFYKDILTIVENYTDVESSIFYKTVYNMRNNYIWFKWSDYIGGCKCTVIHRNGYYVLRWKYKNDNYKVYFGYGVDPYYYKAHHIVNYYRSLDFYIHKLLNIIQWKFRDFRCWIKSEQN